MPMKTGLHSLDALLGGGLPEKYSVLLLGPPKSGKTIFGMQYLFQGLSDDEYGIYIITNNFPEELVKKFEKFGKIEKFLQKGLLRFVDCYSFHTGIQKENTVFIIRVTGPTALTEINIALTEIFKKIPKDSKKRVVFDSVSTLMLYNNASTIADFVQGINRKIKSSQASVVYILEEGMHEEKHVTTLNSLLDGMIHLNKEKNNYSMELEGFNIKPTPLNYSIEDGKITFDRVKAK